MPTYEYECGECGNRFELFQSISEKPTQECPKCRGKVKRLISGGCGLIFKGSGFYSTDYKKKPSGSENSTSGEKKEKPSCDAGSGSCCAGGSCPEKG
ncbi:MAG: zinc ribbon domain-containing protein [Candidatus Omnitrophica bacterium]|nr:zinc ribbon domain-containing protein [Candidatus Omnitrophota bacterium]